nr:MAG TPA: hypothetical protein [Caudoviricetes sp.]
MYPYCSVRGGDILLLFYFFRGLFSSLALCSLCTFFNSFNY